MKYIALILSFIMMTIVFAFATEDMHPPINEKTLVGTWEAISERDTRVYRIEIKEKGDSYLSYAVPQGWHWVFKLEKMEMTKGEVFLSFADIKNPTKIIHIQGKGLAGRDGARDEGVLYTELIMNPKEKPLNKWKLKFIKTPYIEELYKLSQSAEKAIQKIESKK